MSRHSHAARGQHPKQRRRARALHDAQRLFLGALRSVPAAPQLRKVHVLGEGESVARDVFVHEQDYAEPDSSCQQLFPKKIPTTMRDPNPFQP